jgi:hypothetical protein
MIEALAAASEDRRVEDLIFDAQEIFVELSDDSSGPTVDPQDLISLQRAQRFISAALGSLTTARQLIDLARNALADAYTEPVEPCAERGGFSSVCELPKGHDGKHRERSTEWDEESQRAFAKAMSGGRFGRLD